MKDLKGALPIVAKSVSDKYDGLRVEIGGRNACTDGNTIVLPTLPETNEARLLARGFIDHEAAHIKHTNFEIQNSPILNALEDVRIEREISNRFPGSKKNLRDLIEHLINEGQVKVSGKEGDDSLLIKYAHLKLRKDVLGHNVDSVLQKAADKIVSRRSRLGKAFKQKVDGILSTERLQSTADAEKMGKKLLALLGQQEQGSDQNSDQSDSSESGQDNGDSGQNGESGSDSSGSEDKSDSSDSDGSDGSEGNEGEQNGESDSSDPGESQEDENDGSGSGGSGSEENKEDEEEQGNESGGDSGQPGGDDSAGDSLENVNDQRGTFQGTGEILKKMLNAKGGTNPGKSTQDRVEMMEEFSDVESMDLDHKDVQMSEEFRENLNAVKRESAKLRKKLCGVLEAKRRDETKLSRRGKNFVKKDLYRLGVKDTRVFNRKVENKGLNTALYILVDTSGSMIQGQKRRDLGFFPTTLALSSAYSLGLALDRMTSIKYALGSYPHSERGGNGDIVDNIYSIKDFDDNLNHERFKLNSGGTTPTAAAMWHAAYKLSFRQEERKMLFVLTDGEPDDRRLTAQMDERLRKNGIEVFGLGMACDSVKDVFADHFYLYNIKELTPCLFRTLEQKLR